MTGRRRNLLDQILVDSTSCLCIVDARRRIRFFSPGMASWTGWPASEIEGLSCDVVASDKNNASDLLAAAFQPGVETWQGRVTFREAVLPTQSGGALQANFCFIPLCSDSGQIERVFITRLDKAVSVSTSVPGSIGQQLHAEVAALRADFRVRRGWNSIVGKHDSMVPVRQLAGLLRDSDCNFCLVGESGTGRRHLAQAIHVGSSDAEPSCVSVFCDLLSPEMLYDSLRELHRMTAEFSGPHEHPGMLLLVEVARIPREVQQWLVQHVSDHAPFRIGCTSSVGLEQIVSEGWMLPEFRQLVAPIEVSLPRLHSRGRDVLLLAREFIERNRRLRQTEAQELSNEVAEELMNYQWPGNIRELEKVIHDACDTCSGSVIVPEDLPFAFRAGVEAQVLAPRADPKVQSLDELLRNAEKRILEATLRRCQNNKAEVARRLGLTRPSLYRRLKSLGLDDQNQT